MEEIPWLIWLLWTPTTLGMGCAVYAILWRVENTFYCVRDCGKTPGDGHLARTSRDLRYISWIVSVIVAGSALLVGGLLPNLHAHLLGNLQIYPFVVFVEAFTITLSTMLVVEATVRQWEHSRQFGLRDLFMITTAVASA